MAHHGRSVNKASTKSNSRGKQAVGKALGRTAKTRATGPDPEQPHHEVELKVEANNPMSAGVLKRGDRRQMNPDPGMRANRVKRDARESAVEARPMAAHRRPVKRADRQGPLGKAKKK